MAGDSESTEGTTDRNSAEEAGSGAKRSDSDDRRHAARIATLVAVPVTLVAAVGVFALIGSGMAPGEEPDDPESLAVPSAPVSMDVPELEQADLEVCRALVTEVPASLVGLEQRAVTGDHAASEISAAWGEPPVAMRCGVATVDLADDAEVYQLGATCWYAAESDDGSTWTTVDRVLPVRVDVPAGLDSQVVQGLSEAVSGKVPPLDDLPTGCGG